MIGVDYDVVIPTIGRASLSELLRSLAAAAGPKPNHIYIVDDRPEISSLDISALGDLQSRATVLHSFARGPAAARNRGALATSASWIAFLDDDVQVTDGWCDALVADLRDAIGHGGAVGTQGKLRVPLPSDRRPTDWERNVAGLESSAWITADMAYRRLAFFALGGFDERLRRAFREDADLALRAQAQGHALIRGRREALHPVRPAKPWISVRLQAGNGDDAFMSAIHGDDWFERAQAPRGRRTEHFVTTALAGAALTAAGLRQGRLSAACALGWAAMTSRFAWLRIAPGPRTMREVATMIATSIAIPPAATYHYAAARATMARRIAHPRSSVLHAA